jgi:rhodanese-related sulfurtransferase
MPEPATYDYEDNEVIMGLFKTIKRLFGKSAPPPPHLPLEPEPEEVAVPEVSVGELLDEVAGDIPPLLLDVRELYEWRQVSIPGALHIPMNDTPERLDELPKDREIVVFCAHGSRSYGVAGYLIEQGYRARSLAGGITQWRRQGGEVEIGGKKRSEGSA